MTERVVLPIHGLDHCPGGPDPIPCLGTAVVIMQVWNYDTDNTVPDQTWTPVANFAFGGGFYEETFISPANQSDISWDYKTGQLTLSTPWVYDVFGWVQFWDDAVVNEVRAVAIRQPGGSLRYVQEFTNPTTTEPVALHRLPIFIPRIGAFTCRLECWHNHGSAIAIRAATFGARRHESASEPPAVFTANNPYA